MTDISQNQKQIKLKLLNDLSQVYVAKNINQYYALKSKEDPQSNTYFYKIIGQCLYKSDKTYKFQYLEKEGDLLILQKNLNDKNEMDIEPENNEEINDELEQLDFEHSSQCPCQALNNLKTIKFQKHDFKINIGMAAIIIDADMTVLLVKRKNTDDFFPGEWICPGNLTPVVKGESLKQQVLNAVKSEVGINIKNESLRQNQKGLVHEATVFQSSFAYENVYPVNFSEGFPQYQEITIFFTICLRERFSEMNIKLNDDKIQCSTIISLHNLFKLWNPSIQENYELLKKNVIIRSTNNNKEYVYSLIVFQDKYPNIFNEGVNEGHIKAIKNVYQSSN